MPAKQESPHVWRILLSFFGKVDDSLKLVAGRKRKLKGLTATQTSLGGPQRGPGPPLPAVHGLAPRLPYQATTSLQLSLRVNDHGNAQIKVEIHDELEEHQV